MKLEPLPKLSQEMTQVREIILDLFRRIGIADRFCFKGFDPLVKNSFADVIRTWDLGLPGHVLSKYERVALFMATTSYHYTSVDFQVYIALYTLLVLLVDDDIMPTHIIREFPARLLDGRPQLHPILTHLTEQLTNVRQYFPLFCANLVTINTLDFVNAEMFVRDEGGPMVQGRTGVGYIDYIRVKNGLGETYAAFIWPQSQFPETRRYVQTFPYIAIYIPLINDIYSFHKETMAAETENYVTQYRAAWTTSAIDSLREIADRVADLHIKIDEILGDSPERRAWDMFCVGYTEFHLHSPRYRLGEIIPEYCLP
ncbi:isoprenoid synthase domain-containing protein [Cristinia sonorae]|uniref:Isoprenoid synthase domain-containing protein n=1 Tax=Cristinia sonorae TaxID=1940300 RepID=A0A8K0UNZ7_9AGAR|nr:isoprenoid synthase domain-containing protein [Cristinia sonorae]